VGDCRQKNQDGIHIRTGRSGGVMIDDDETNANVAKTLFIDFVCIKIPHEPDEVQALDRGPSWRTVSAPTIWALSRELELASARFPRKMQYGRVMPFSMMQVGIWGLRD
jgi:hypothetical protein